MSFPFFYLECQQSTSLYAECQHPQYFPKIWGELVFVLLVDRTTHLEVQFSVLTGYGYMNRRGKQEICKKMRLTYLHCFGKGNPISIGYADPPPPDPPTPKFLYGLYGGCGVC